MADNDRTLLEKAASELPVVARVYPYCETVRLEWASVHAAHNAQPGDLTPHAPAQAAANERDELRAEVERLTRANAALLDQMHHFAHTDQKLWDESMRTAADFERWVRSRATHMLAQFNDSARASSSTAGDGGRESPC